MIHIVPRRRSAIVPDIVFWQARFPDGTVSTWTRSREDAIAYARALFPCVGMLIYPKEAA